MARMWLARDANIYDESYVFGPEPMFNVCSNEGQVSWESDRVVEAGMPPSAFERLFPDLQLKPGAKPIEVEVEIRRVECKR